MFVKKNKLSLLLGFIALTIGTIGVGFSHQYDNPANAAVLETNSITDYYSSINPNLTGQDLLDALTNLNIGGSGVKGKRTKTVGYKNMWTYYDETDPGENGKYSAFYSGLSLSQGEMNKEHVWPESRGGGSVEGDIHMPRPTWSKDNSSRGNSFYVEDMNSPSAGWDPKFAKNGDITYRGESARIIFYCTTASRSLSLVDKDNDSTSNNTMGKLSDLIKWHLTYEITDREKTRNNAAEKIQGNRNAFIDHPEYVCKIWGNTNETTRALCANDPYGAPAPTSITLSTVTMNLKIGETKTVSVASTSPSNANKSVVWTSLNTNIATVNDNGMISAKSIGTTTIRATSAVNSSVFASLTVNVSEPDPINLTGINLSLDKSSIYIKDSAQVSITTIPTYIYPQAVFSYATNDSNIATVNSQGVVTGVSEGTAIITVTAKQNNNIFSKPIEITVQEKVAPDIELITTSTSLYDGDKVVLATGIGDSDRGVSGWNGTKDAKVTTTKSEWKNYVVKSVKSSTYKLYDESVGEYIASPTDNHFKYDSVGGDLKKNDSGYATCNSRYLCANGTYIRFYTSIGSYTVFKAYKLNTGIDPGPGPGPIELNRIVVSNMPNKTTYSVGEEFDPTGLKIFAVYSDESTELINNYNLSTPDMSTPGTKTITVTYEDLTTSFEITVLASQEITLVSISLSNIKTEYILNESFVKPTVTAYYSDETVVDVTESSYCLGYDKTKLGRQVITVYFDTLNTTFEINVSEGADSEVTSIIIADLPTKTEYYVNEPFDSSGMTVYANYEGGYSVNVTDKCQIVTSDMSIPGDATVTASYKGKTAEITIKVLAIDVHVNSIQLNTHELTLEVGVSYHFNVTFNPTDATDKNITWNTSNPNAVYITDSGMILALQEGESTITVTSLDGDKTDSCLVKVTKSNPSKESGCSGSVLATSVLLSTISILGIGIIITKKKKK